jgi:hypothetical protein
MSSPPEDTEDSLPSQTTPSEQSEEYDLDDEPDYPWPGLWLRRTGF